MIGQEQCSKKDTYLNTSLNTEKRQKRQYLKIVVDGRTDRGTDERMEGQMDAGTDGRTDRRTDIAACRVTCPRLKFCWMTGQTLKSLNEIFSRGHATLELAVLVGRLVRSHHISVLCTCPPVLYWGGVYMALFDTEAHF